MSERDEGDRFPRFLAMVVGAGAVGLAGAALLPRTPEQRMGAFVGVAVAAATGGVALELKRRALEKSLKWALAMLGVTFAMRLVALVPALLVTVRSGWSPLAFVAAFFSLYLVLQWIELTYVMTEMKRRGRGGL